MDRRLYNLQQESEKLNKDVEVLEDALILHHRYKQQDESSVRGIIRKEIGGAIWQHGGTGKLRTYRSAKDLNENNDTASVKRSQRRQRSQATAVSKPLTTSAGKTQGNSGMTRTPECQAVNDEAGNVTNLLNLGNVNIDKVAEMKTKVLEKASMNVIKRKTDFKRDNTITQGEELKGKKGKEKIVKSDKNVNNNAESQSQKGNKTAVKSVDKTTVKEALERETTNLLSDKNNRKEVKQTNRILVDFETEKLDTDDILRQEKGLDKPVEISEVQRAVTPHKSSHSSVPNSNTKSGVDVVLQQKDLLRKSLNCDPDVHLWLRQLGLLEEEKYVQMFAQNEIDMEVLVTLDEKHLEKMGVVALGAMKKLVRGIEELRSSAKKGKNDIIELIQPRKTEVRKSLHDAHTKSSELKRTLSDENRNKEVRKSQSEIQIKNVNSDVRKSRNNAISSSDVDIVQKEKESETSKGRSYHSTKTSALSNDVISVPDKGPSHMRDTKQQEERKKINSLSLKEKKDSQLRINSVDVGSKDDCYGKFARSTNSKKPEKNVTSLKRSNSFHSQSNTKSETEPGKSGQQVQKPSSSKERTERKRDDSLTRVQGVRVRADSASSSGRSQGKGSNRPKSGQKPPKGKTVLTQKKAEEGVKSAAEKYEEKQKQEVEDEKRKVKDQERQKQYRDVMAARHQRRQTDRRKNDTAVDIADIDSDSDDEIDDNSNPHLAQLIGVKITNNEKSDKGVKPPLPSGESSEGRQMSRAHLDKPPVKQSMAFATNSVQLTPHFTGNPQNSSRSSAKSYARYSYSARKNTVKDIESQIASLQKKALAGEMVTMDLVKDLQKRLEEIESSIKQSNNTATKKERAKYRKPVIKEDTSSEEEESDILKPLSDLDIQKVLSKSSKVKGLSVSMSKKELMKEIHKEKVAHRKEIRHLRAELNRTRSTDPGKAVEVDQKDLDFQESDLIGEGAFSKVYHGVYQGTDVAVKQLKVPLSSHDRNYFAAEVSLLRDLRHPRVVLLMGVVTTNRFPLMILEYMARGSLYHLLHDQSRDVLDHAEYYRYAHDIALGMNYLHQHKPTVLHLDLKSMNVLICSNDRAKIADFGFSKFRHDADVKAISSSKSKPVRAFPAWTAPELLETGEINPKADVYSFAIILWEMLTRKQPYEGCSVFQVLERTRLNKRPEIPENVPKELSDFIKQCWDPLPSRRPPFKEILHHLENMAFPPDWQALLKEAGVPPVALEDVQSTRTIISLVNNTLDTENVKTMVEEVRMSCDSHVTENMGLEYLYNQDHVELYTPRSPARVVKEKSTAMMKNSLTRDIEALATEETFGEVDDSYLSFSGIRGNNQKSQGTLCADQLLTSPHFNNEKSPNLSEDKQIISPGRKQVNTKEMGTSTSIDMHGAFGEVEENNSGQSGVDSVKLNPLHSDSDHNKHVYRDQDKSPRHSVSSPKLNLTKAMIESMVKDRRVTIASKSMDMKGLRESLLSQVKQSPKALRTSLDASLRDKTPVIKPLVIPKSRRDDNMEDVPKVIKSAHGSELQMTVTKTDAGSTKEEHGQLPHSDVGPKVEKGTVEIKESKSELKGEKKDTKVTESRSEDQDVDKPIPTPRNINKTDADEKEKKKIRQEDLNAQIKRKLAERNKAKKENKQEKVSDKNKDSKLRSQNIENSDVQKQCSEKGDNFVKDSLDLDSRDVQSVEKTDMKNDTDKLEEEEEDVSEIENDSLENSPRDSLEDRCDVLQENTKAQPFTVVTDSAPKFQDSSAKKKGGGKVTEKKLSSDSDKLNTSADSSLKTCRQSIEAWVEERPEKDFVGTSKQKTRKVTPPSPHSVPPPPILIPENPPPAPPAPPAPPIPTQDSAFLVVKSTVKNPHRSNSKNHGKSPKDNSAKPKTTTNSDLPYTVQSMELRAQKEMLQSTSKPHPNQLHDLSGVSRGTMSSIAEILKRAVFDRRVAMGEDVFSPSASVASSWSFMDE